MNRPYDQDSAEDGTMKKELERLGRKREAALQMGGPEKIARQHQQGKLTARERISLLLDPGTFEEYGLLATHRSHRREMADKITPADGVITTGEGGGGGG